MSKQQQAAPRPKPRKHDAGIFRDGTYFEASPWSWSGEPRRALAYWKRALITAGCLLAALSFAAHRAATERAFLLALSPAAGTAAVLCFRRWQDRDHHRMVRQLARRTASVLDQPVRQYRAWLDVPQDYRTREDCLAVTFDVPPDFTGQDRDMEDLARAVTVTTGIEAPDVDRKLASWHPQLLYYRSDPPPSEVTWKDIEPDVTAAGPDELVVGLGRKRKPVKASLSLDSPHFMINMGSGAGKSTLAGFWLVQELRRGGIALILDAKHFSHPWAFKDIDAEYGLLPNVRYARWIPDLHDAMVWLGQELSRRTEKAERVINSQGKLLGDVGPRLFVVAEEMNLATPLLKAHWADTRGPDQVKKSPALTGFGAVAFAGREVKMHLIVIGQQLTADTLGGGGSGGAVRENIGVKCMARYSANAWRMQAGDAPMPPSPWAPGRVQCLAGGDVTEAQAPDIKKQLRDLALAGAVTTECPPDMPGTGRGGEELRVPPVTAIDMGAEQPYVLGMTLAEAIAEGVLRRTIESARKEAQRPGFPDPVEPPRRGIPSRYRPSELAAWEKR